MKQKAKLVATLMAMCMVVSFAVIGILAVKTLNMSVGGNISFFAEGVSFTISNGAFYQTDKTTAYNGITTQTNKLQGFAMNTNTKLADVENQIASWTNLDLRLDNQGDAVLKFNIKNDMSDKQLYVLFEVTLGTNTNNNMNIVCETSQLIYPTENKNIEITFDILDMNINAGLTGFAINLCISEPVEVDPTTGVVTNQTNSKYSNASYNIDTTAGTAKISKSSDNISGELVLMDKVYVGGQEYVVTEIERKAFEACRELTGDLIIPNTITTIGHNAFTYCTGMKGRLVIPNSVVYISYSVFADCNFVGTLFIPKSVKTIEVAAFAGCNFSEVIVDSENTVYMAKGNCLMAKSTKKLLQVFDCSELPQDGSFLSVERYAFSRVNIEMRDFQFPSQITTIPANVFFICKGLKSIIIDENIVAIDQDAFWSCNKLEYVIIKSSTPPTLGSGAFEDTNNCPIYVPSGSVQAYKTASGWSVYADRIFAIY